MIYKPLIPLARFSPFSPQIPLTLSFAYPNLLTQVPKKFASLEMTAPQEKFLDDQQSTTTRDDTSTTAAQSTMSNLRDKLARALSPPRRTSTGSSPPPAISTFTLLLYILRLSIHSQARRDKILRCRYLCDLFYDVVTTYLFLFFILFYFPFFPPYDYTPL